jgi:hypothetical protein
MRPYIDIHGLHEELEFPIVGMVSLFPEMYSYVCPGNIWRHEGTFKDTP